MAPLRGKERQQAADAVGSAVLNCIHTLQILEALSRHPQAEEERLVPFADNVRRAVAEIEPLRPVLVQLLYDLPNP